MELKLYNTLTKTKEVFKPLDAKNVRLYVCGPTVYDYAHIGNARPVIVFDVLFRFLRHIYGESHVTYARNITDIDDKINARASEEGVSIRELTERTNAQYQQDVAALGCLPPTHQPRATDHIPQMIAMIETLIAAGHAYVAEGHVLYDVTSKPDYGKLARRSLDEMLAGARVEVAPYKKGPMDFVLWKPSPPELPGWESPWGRGRPGWHIECSAMSNALLGETFDIHGGGIDLVFPHHENEIAQSEGAHHGHPLAKVWMHNGFLQVEGEKMSKSLGNFVTINELFRGWHDARWTGATARHAMLMTHYRQPIDWTASGLAQARHELFDWAAAISEAPSQDYIAGEELDSEFVEALCDDLNTAAAITRLRELHSAGAKGDSASLARLKQGVLFLGMSAIDKPGYFSSMITFENKLPVGDNPTWIVANEEKVARANGQLELAEIQQGKLAELGWVSEFDRRGFMFVRRADSQSIESKICRLIEARNAARKAKDFKEADRIRAELEAMGVQLKDNTDGTTSWEPKR